MCRQLAYLVAALVVATAGAVQAGEWTDTFDAPHDYLTDGVEGTGWDGFIGLEDGQTADAINASIDQEGQLYLASADAVWSPQWNPLGPFLYRVIAGDFVATVEVTDYQNIAYNYCGLMARVADTDDAGNGEDWISVSYFPLYNVGIIGQFANNGQRTEDTGGNGTGFDAPRFLQLERQGNTFHLRTSDDGVTFDDYPDAQFTGLVRDDMDGLPVQVGMWHATFTGNLGYVTFDNFYIQGENIASPNQAFGAEPANEATDVLRGTDLSWRAAEMAVSHDVYLGTVFEDVNTASRENPLNVQVAQAQETTTYTPPNGLIYGQTYYWRVDEVEADGTIRPGKVWQFTAEPYAYVIENVQATASAFVANSDPNQTINESGLTDGLHSEVKEQMWQIVLPTDPNAPAWIQYGFDQPYKLHEMMVWNGNVSYEYLLDFSIKDVTVQYSVDANDWTTLGQITLAKGTGMPGLPAETFSLDGVLAQYVRLNVDTNYGGANAALSEIKFFQVPVAARQPQPEPGSTDVDPDVVLQWRPGREADVHEVYFGTDALAVADGTAFVDAVTEPSFMPGPLELGQTYYWMIVEVNEAATPSAWASDVWDFNTPEFIVVDDMESYDDAEGTRIFEIWIDGYGVNSNGSLVGHDTEPFAEETLVHSGDQSMPFRYGQNGATNSEATLSLAGENWTRSGVQTLVVWFRGRLGNAPGQLYAKINGGAPVNYTGNAAALAAPLWKQWNIDLSSLGAAASNVTSLTLGVSGAGQGQLYFDDIRLYAAAPPMEEPAADPGTANLRAHYTMENSVADVSGNGYNATAMTGASFGTSLTGYGRALVLDGVSGYAELPIGPVVQSASSMTVAAWANWNGDDGIGRIFDFGSGGTVNMWMAPDAYGGLVFAITSNGFNNESRVVAPDELPTGWHHVAVTIDGATSEMTLYLDGSVVDTETTQTLPSALGNTTQNWIARSQYAADAYFGGSEDDFRIYNRALSGAEVRYLVGDR